MVHRKLKEQFLRQSNNLLASFYYSGISKQNVNKQVASKLKKEKKRKIFKLSFQPVLVV